MTAYSTIMADPPWPYGSSGAHLRATHDHRPNSFDSELNTAGSASRYGSMSISELCELKPPHAKNAHLYLWTTHSFLVEAHNIARAWGFEPKTLITWVKVKPDGTPSCKTGYYFRGAAEYMLFCVSGSMPLLTGKAAIPNVVLSPRLSGHSVKPDWAYDLAERCSPGPRLEMFARRARLGWDAFGDEVECAWTPESLCEPPTFDTRWRSD